MQVKKGGVASLVLTIEIRPGVTDTIEVRLNDKLSALVKEFCDRHRLRPEKKEFIYEHLRKNVLKMLEDLGTNKEARKSTETGSLEQDDKEVSNKVQTQGSENSKLSPRSSYSVGKPSLKPTKFVGFASRAYKNKLVKEVNSQKQALRS